MTKSQTRSIELARRILELLRRDQAAVGDRLRESQLASRMGVSRSPVRNALALLADLGVVVHQPHHGYRLLADITEPTLEMINLPPTPEERLYRIIASERFANLIPEQVSVSDMVRRYDSDRATINRVLARMTEEGLVERAPGRGWIFGPALNDAGAYAESYRFRVVLEPAALLEQNFRVDEPRFREIRARHAELIAGGVRSEPINAIFETDAAFHETLADCSHNRFIAQAIRQQTRLRRLSEYENYSDRGRLEQSCHEHLAILDAVEVGNRTRAAELMRRHILVSEDIRPDFEKVRVLAHRRLTRF